MTLLPLADAYKLPEADCKPMFAEGGYMVPPPVDEPVEYICVLLCVCVCLQGRGRVEGWGVCVQSECVRHGRRCRHVRGVSRHQCRCCHVYAGAQSSHARLPELVRAAHECASSVRLRINWGTCSHMLSHA